MSDPILVPIGYYCGPLFTGQPHPYAWIVRVGEREVQLTSYDALNLWFIARGLEPDFTRNHTRSRAVERAKELDIAEPEELLGKMIELGCIASIDSDDEVRRFLRDHRLDPLLVGISNSPDEPDRIFLGVSPEYVVCEVTPEQFELWTSAEAERNLGEFADGLERSAEGHLTAGEASRRTLDHASALVAFSAGYVDEIRKVGAFGAGSRAPGVAAPNADRPSADSPASDSSRSGGESGDGLNSADGERADDD